MGKFTSAVHAIRVEGRGLMMRSTKTELAACGCKALFHSGGKPTYIGTYLAAMLWWGLANQCIFLSSLHLNQRDSLLPNSGIQN